MTDDCIAQHLDVTRELCPMTYVRARLALDRLPPGGVLQVRLRGEEPVRNVSRNALALGHVLLATRPMEDGSVVLEIQRR